MPPPQKKSFRKPASDAEPAAHEPPAAPPKPKPRPSGEPKLSFDLDDEGEAFQLKKRKRKPPPPAPPPDDDAALPGANSLFPARGVYTSEMMARLRASTVRLPYSGAAPDEPPAALPELPDAEAIRAARAQRERARRQVEEAEAGGGVRAEAEAEAEEFIPLEKGGESRHVREEDEREEASVFDEEQQGGRLSFGPPPRDGGRAGAARREARFTAVMEVEEVEEDDSPVLLARGGALAGGAGEEGGEAAVPSHGPGSVEAISQLARELLSAKPGQTVEKLQAELRRLEEALAVQERDEAETQRLINEAAAECGTLEEQLQQQLKQFDFLQRAQAYTEDLLDCLNEKAASIEACERALCEAIEAHAARARRHEELLLATARARAQASLPPHHFWRARPTPRHALAAPHAPPPPLPPECGAEGNAAAMAALHAAEEARRRGGGEWVGWGSDEEAEGEAEGVARVVEEGERLFADTAAEYCEVARVRRRFAEWRRVDEASYNDSYIELCLPTLLAPLVRTQMLRWQPLRSGSVEEQAWYKDCMAASDADEEDGDLAEAERLLLAQLVCKVAMPRVEHAVKFSWLVHSQKQGSQLLQAVRELSTASDFLTRRAKRLASQGQEDEDETAAAQVAESSLRQLLMSVASRLEAAVADVCVPPCVAPPHADALAERVAADAAYSAWRSLKLLAAISAWAEFLSAGALQDLAAELLSDHLIPYLRAHLASPAPRWRMLAAAVRQASGCLPLAWRRPDASGGGAWSARLHTFLVNEAGPAFRRAHPAPPLPAEVDGAVEALCEAFVALQDAPQAESLKAAFEVQ